MKKVAFLFCVSLLLGACSQSVYNEKPTLSKIQNTKAAVKYFEDEMSFTTNPGGIKTEISKGQAMVIVDVRREVDFEAGHIPGAVNIPFDKWDKFEGDQTQFPHLRKDVFNYVYCYELLCNLAQKAAKKFASLGYPSKEMKGGFQSWKEHKYPIDK
jgi:hypothetical protein